MDNITKHGITGLLKWIDCNIDSWYDITNKTRPGIDNSFEVLQSLIVDSQYETAYSVVAQSMDEYYVFCTVSRWINLRLLEEINNKGADRVSDEFMEILRYEQERLSEDDDD